MNLEQKKRCWMYVSQGPEGWLAHQFTGTGLPRYLAKYLATYILSYYASNFFRN